MGDQRAYVERDGLQKVDRIAGLQDVSVDGGPSGTILHQLTFFSSRSAHLRAGGLKRKASKLANRCVQQTWYCSTTDLLSAHTFPKPTDAG